MKTLKSIILVLLFFCSLQKIQAKAKIPSASETPPITITYSVTSIPCNGSNIDITVQGGIVPYTFIWSNGETTEDLSGINPGSYQVTVTDSVGTQALQEFTITGDSVFTISAIVNDVTCPTSRDGSARIIVKGGHPPFTYLWSNGSTSSEITNQRGGIFTATVTDSIGCSKSIKVSIAAAPRFGFDIKEQDVSCAGGNDGSISVVATGGSAPYTYLWSNGDTLPEIHNLSAGAYQLILTDRRNCKEYLEVDIFSPDSISATSTTSINCQGGTIDLNISGGVPSYHFIWSNGDTTQNLSGLIAGRYSVEITDSNGCYTKPMSIDVANFPKNLFEIDKTDVSCYGQNNGSITLKPISGSSPFHFTWSNGDTTASLSGLAPGKYSVQIVDSNGCSNDTNSTITEPTLLQATIAVSGKDCDLTVTGGTPPYTYLWSNGSTSEDLTGLNNGTYTVVIKDLNNCTATASAIVNVVPPVLNASIDCCQDTYINSGGTINIPVYFNMPGSMVLTYKEIYDHKTSSTKTVATSGNPYIITSNISSTTTYQLLSVSQNNVNGTVCGQATIGVNNFTGRCTSNCFSAEVLSVENNGNCKTYNVKIINDGNCRFGLSHVSVSVPCGNIQSVSNDRNYQIVYGMDPTTRIIGFKLDNISNFGEKKDGTPESFLMSYTICPDNNQCGETVCNPLMSFKAGQCVFYVEATSGMNGSAGSTIPTDSSDVNPGEVTVFPNPVEGGQAITIVLPDENDDDSGHNHGKGDNKGNNKNISVSIIDQYGNVQYSKDFQNEDNNREIKISESCNLKQGLYLVTVKKGSLLYKHKLIIN